MNVYLLPADPGDTTLPSILHGTRQQKYKIWHHVIGVGGLRGAHGLLRTALTAVATANEQRRKNKKWPRVYYQFLTLTRGFFDWQPSGFSSVALRTKKNHHKYHRIENESSITDHRSPITDHHTSP